MCSSVFSRRMVTRGAKQDQWTEHKGGLEAIRGATVSN